MINALHEANTIWLLKMFLLLTFTFRGALQNYWYSHKSLRSTRRQAIRKWFSGLLKDEKETYKSFKLLCIKWTSSQNAFNFLHFFRLDFIECNFHFKISCTVSLKIFYFVCSIQIQSSHFIYGESDFEPAMK